MRRLGCDAQNRKMVSEQPAVWRWRRALKGVLLGGLFLLVLVPAHAVAQTPAKIDFGRDVQPLLKEHCVSCHGPAQQMNGLVVFGLRIRLEA